MPDPDDEIRALAQDVQRRQSRPRAPQRMAEVVSSLMARRGYAHEQSALLSQQAWRAAAGEALAAHTRPANIRRGVLEVYVRNSAIMQELTFQRRPLIEKLSRALPELNIRDLRFRIAVID